LLELLTREIQTRRDVAILSNTFKIHRLITSQQPAASINSSTPSLSKLFKFCIGLPASEMLFLLSPPAPALTLPLLFSKCFLQPPLVPRCEVAIEALGKCNKLILDIREVQNVNIGLSRTRSSSLVHLKCQNKSHQKGAIEGLALVDTCVELTYYMMRLLRAAAGQIRLPAPKVK